MKKLLLLLFLIPNLVMGASYLCIEDLSTGYIHDPKNQTAKKTDFLTAKWIIKKTNNIWRVYEFGKNEVSYGDCKPTYSLDNELTFISCDFGFQEFSFTKETMRFIKINEGNWRQQEDGMFREIDTIVSIGKCSSI